MHVLVRAALALSLFATGCASVGKRSAKPVTNSAAAATISYQAPAEATLGAAVRAVGTQAPGLVLMQGLEWREAHELKLEKTSPAEAAAKIATIVGGKVQAAEGYYFIYAPGYEQLEQVTLGQPVPASLQTMSAATAFGAGTKLYSVFAVLSKTLATTIIGDNAIAEAECGELVLPELPIPAVLEAILKSARVPQEGLELISGDSFVFFRSRAIPQRSEILLNAGALADPDRAILERRATVELPRPQARAEMFLGAVPLEEVLPELSRQLAVPVRAEAALKNLPVNPAVFTDLPLQTIMDLLIRQWLVPQYGYTVEEGRIVIREAAGQ